MAAGAVDVTIAATPDEVWEKVGDFAGVGVTSSRASSPSAWRATTASSACSAWRSASGCWPGTRRAACITYSVVDGVPIESHTATISVEPDGDGSKVIWAYDVTPDEMAPIFGDTYKGALAALENAFS